MAAASATPSTAAATTPAVSPTEVPTPRATIDSPRAMSTISPWRSAKWAGSRCQPSDPNRNGTAMSTTSATAHSAPCTQPSQNAGDGDQATPR